MGLRFDIAEKCSQEKSDIIKDPEMDKSKVSKKIITKQYIEDIIINSIKYDLSSDEEDY